MAAPVDYEATIKPLLKQRCASCHGALKQEADLRLDAGALIPPEIRSEILNRVASNDESERMPPEGPRLTAEQIANLQEWIAADAPFPKNEVVPTKPAEHWSFQPVKRPPLPTSKHEHPIDAFLFGQRDAPPLVWGGEFGRTPTSEGVGKPGRDHDWHGYSMWLAGAGVKGGQAIGATDDLGFKAVEDRCHVSDLHATLLHLMGLDHTRLSYQHLGLDQRLTGVEQRHIVTKALA